MPKFFAKNLKLVLKGCASVTDLAHPKNVETRFLNRVTNLLYLLKRLLLTRLLEIPYVSLLHSEDKEEKRLNHVQSYCVSAYTQEADRCQHLKSRNRTDFHDPRACT